MGGKEERCVWLITYHFHVPIVRKSGSLDLFEPRGPVQTSTGIVSSFLLYLWNSMEWPLLTSPIVLLQTFIPCEQKNFCIRL